MGIDLTGGLDRDREYFFDQRPDDPEMRDSASMWISDDQGEIGLPRVGIEAVASDWDHHGYQLNLGLRGGRVIRARETGDSRLGDASVLGTGPLAFRCVEPFRTWRAEFDGEADSTTITSLIKGQPDFSRTPLAFSVTATMAVPPWIQGALQSDAGERLASSVEGDLMGGPRYEQLFRCTGTVTVDGETREFSGSGLRIRRQGVRRLQEFWGHCWQSALFPSGKAFGYIAYPPRADGEPTFNEGFVFDGAGSGASSGDGDGELIPARVVSAPWLKTLEPAGEDVSVVLETSRGEVRIGGTTALPTIDVFRRPEMPNFPVMFQGGVRYTWDGEETYGMLERSTQRDKIAWPG
jgi:hypothetical protein